MLDFLYSAGAKRALMLLSALIIILLLVTNLFVISLLIGASALLSLAIGKLRIKVVGLELVTFITVLSALAYGPAAGAVIGLVLIIFHLAIPQYSGAYVAWVIPEYVLAAILATAISGSVGFVGIAVTLILNAINIFLTFLVYKEHLPKYLPYAVTNVIFNVILFTQAGEAVLRMLK